MMPRRFFTAPGFGLAVLLMAMAFVTGCASHARSTAVRTESKPARTVEEYKADEFVGVPIVGDYDNDRNLDFILEVTDKDRTFKIKVHEEYGETNGEVLNKIRDRINNAVDRDRIRVIGYYNSEYKGPEKEYGFMDLKTIVFYDEKSGYEEAYFTDDKGSRFYDEGDVTIIYAPGHHYRSVYYPRYCSPWWDNDGDGIPNAYDPWPNFYDVWYDYNLNGFPDWYDPYYCNVYPYWRHWDMGFWVSYNWYSPSYFRSYRHHPRLYYDDYGTYSRLYDQRLEGRNGHPYRLSPNTNDYAKDLDPKRQWRNDQVHGGGREVVRGTAATLGGEVDRYERLAVDRRRLAPVNTTGRSGGSEVASNVTSSSTGGGTDDRTFTRNRSLKNVSNSGYTGRERTADRNYTTPDLTKSKASGGVSGTDARQTPGGGRERDYTPSRGSSGSDNRVYSPSTRARTVGGESPGTNASSANPVSRAVSRERNSGRTTAPSDYSTPSSSTGTRNATDNRYRGSYVTSRSRGGYTTPSSTGSSSSGSSEGGYSAPSRERSSSGGSYTPSSGGSRGGSYTPSSGGSHGSSAPAVSHPSSSGGGSRTAPAASQPSSGGSRSRDSGSSSSGSSSRGGDRTRR